MYLCQQLAVLQPNLRGVFELLLEACASSHDDRDFSDEQVTRIEQFIRREVLMSIENLVPSRSHKTQMLQWTGDNFNEVLTWLKDLNRDINLDISETDSPALEIPDGCDGILRVNMYDYITRDLNDILGTLHPSKLIN
jgi:hypothetical protein